MLSLHELMLCVLLPVMVSAIIAAIGAWRQWPWAFPVAAGAGFLVAYAAIGVPKLPPADGTDWVFWLAIPAVVLAVADAFTNARWGSALGLLAGGVALVVLWPLVGGSVTGRYALVTTILMAVVGAAVALTADVAGRRVGTSYVAAALAIVAGGAGVVILSSHARTVGMHGIALAAALGPVAVFAFRVNRARPVAIPAGALIVGLLVSGRFYADVSAVNFGVLLAAPLLLLVGAVTPTRRAWVRGIVALSAVAIAVAAVTGPTALEAKRTAEADPYAAYR